MPNYTHDRPTVGALPGWSPYGLSTHDRYLISVFRGIQSAARDRRCHLLLACGAGRVIDPGGIHPAWPVVSPDSDFVPVGPWNTDGLIVFAPLLNEARSLYLRQLITEGHPVLFVATGESDPSVAADNEGGIRQALAHLVEHGHRRIAFIAGDPADRGDSEYRLRAFRSFVAEYGLEADPRLIAHGRHTRTGGYAALREILDSGAEFTAVMASDDVSAIGAMRAIQEAGLRIPRDVAVIGFDDQPDAVAQVPPLASVHIPLAEIGCRALELMLDHIEGRTRLESNRVSTRLVPRQSCGCLPGTLLSAANGGPLLRPGRIGSPRTSDERNRRAKQRLVDEMVAALPTEARHPDADWPCRLCARLVEAFAAGLDSGDTAQFQTTLMELLQEVELVDDDAHAWQEIISVLRRKMTRLPKKWTRSKTRRYAEDLLHQARAAISESTQRQDHRHRYQENATADRVSVLTARLSASLDEHQAVEILAEHLPELDIRHARVALFEPAGNDAVAWSAVIGAGSSPESASRRFPSRQFPPPGLYPPGELLSLALLPLVFQDEALGYVAFDAGNLEPCAAIARQLAAAFKSARLHAQVIELSLTDSLTGLRNRRYFELFLKNEVERCRRSMRGLAVIMIDLDHFKKYNDAFGHLAGDEALQHVARCLLDACRKMDVVARYGGEEFAIILPESDADGASVVAENIRTAVAGIALKRSLTVSLGVAAARGNQCETESLVRRADRALYEAKRTGRNRMYVFQDWMLEP